MTGPPSPQSSTGDQIALQTRLARDLLRATYREALHAGDEESARLLAEAGKRCNEVMERRELA